MGLYDGRSPYSGMSDEMKDVIIAADELEQKMEVVVVDAEIEAMELEDKSFDMKVSKIFKNLKKKYGIRDLTLVELQLEMGYTESKVLDFMKVYGNSHILLVSKIIVHDANDETARGENHKRLTNYLAEKYSGYEGIPTEHLEMETQTDYKVCLPMAKKLMELKPSAIVKFIPFEVVTDINMEDM